MRVFGDLDGRESHGPNDLSGSRAAGGNGNHKERIHRALPAESRR